MANERFDSVWEAIGNGQAESGLLKTKAALMRALCKRIENEGWTQSQAAERLGVHQPRVSDLVRGKLSAFSLDNLYAMAETLGLKPELRWSEAA